MKFIFKQRGKEITKHQLEYFTSSMASRSHISKLAQTKTTVRTEKHNSKF